MLETARDTIIEQMARLRFACYALGVQPDDVRLEDLAPEVADGFRKQARADYMTLLTRQPAKEGAKPC